MKRSSWDGDAGKGGAGGGMDSGRTPRTGAPPNQPARKPPLSSINMMLVSSKSKRQKQVSLTSLWAAASTPSLGKQLKKRSNTPVSAGSEGTEGPNVWPSTAQRKLEKFGLGEVAEEPALEPAPPSLEIGKRSSSKASCDSTLDPDDFQLFSQPEYTRVLSQETPAVSGKDHWNSSAQDDVFGWLGASQHIIAMQSGSQAPTQAAGQPHHPLGAMAGYTLQATLSSPQLGAQHEQVGHGLQPVDSLSCMLSLGASLSVVGVPSSSWAIGGGSPYRRGGSAASQSGPALRGPVPACCQAEDDEVIFRVVRGSSRARNERLGAEHLRQETCENVDQPDSQPELIHLLPVHAPSPALFDDGGHVATPELSQPEVLLELDTNGQLGGGSGVGGLSHFARRNMFPLMRQVSNRKLLCIIRHGESTFNQADATCKSFSDPMIFDPHLTELGHVQTRALQSRLEAMIGQHGSPLWVVSPLTRTIQSFLNACPQPLSALQDSDSPAVSPPSQPMPSTPPPAIANVLMQPLIAEYVVTAGDVGRPVSQLARDFPQLAPQLSKIPETWWFQDPKRPNCAIEQRFGSLEPKERRKARLDDFQRWLGSRSEKFIVLVGHCSFWSSFLPNGQSKMSNGEVRLVGY